MRHPFRTNFHLFVRSYIETMLWSSTDEDGTPLDRDYGAEDLSGEALKATLQECRQFWSLTSHIYEHLIDEGDAPMDVYRQAGHDFWLTRNGHGAGFWDGDWPKPWDQVLTEHSKTFGEVTPLAGDDGRIYLM